MLKNKVKNGRGAGGLSGKARDSESGAGFDKLSPRCGLSERAAEAKAVPVAPECVGDFESGAKTATADTACDSVSGVGFDKLSLRCGLPERAADAVPDTYAATPIIAIKNVSRTFPPDTHALCGVSFDVYKGDFIVMAGANGSGKSVLLSLIAGLDEPSDGCIERAPSLKTGIVFQDADSQILGETVFEDVAFGARNMGLRGESLSRRVDEALSVCGLAAKKEFASRVLSGGEKRRLAVAGVLAMQTDVILFDEPFANLDWRSVQSVCALLRTLKQNGTTVLVLTHELEKVLALANRFMVLDSGKIRFDGTPSDGLRLDLGKWSIRNPIDLYGTVEKMIWD